jgi:hypothetical protein
MDRKEMSSVLVGKLLEKWGTVVDRTKMGVRYCMKIRRGWN